MNLNFDEICRLCLRFCDEYVDLNQTNGVKTLADDLVEKIRYCYYVQIDSSEGLPTKVCYECIQVLSYFYTTKNNVIISDKLLRDILFVRKKVQEEGGSHGEENVTSPDIIEIKQDEQNTRNVVAPNNSELNTPDENSTKVTNVKLNFNNQCINTSKESATNILENVENEKETVNYDPDSHNSITEKPQSKVKKKKKLDELTESIASTNSTPNDKSNHVTKPLTPSSSNLKDLKKVQIQRGKASKPVKDKTMLEDESPLKENVVKEIGTVIDTNNILSPNVKRTRKSISAR